MLEVMTRHWFDFLDKVRTEQPQNQAYVQDFFGDRRLAADRSCREDADIYGAVAASRAIEVASGKTFIFLTATSDGAQRINNTRCVMDFEGHEQLKSSHHARQGDPEYGGKVVAIPGLRIRLERNVDKERGFVNCALL